MELVKAGSGDFDTIKARPIMRIKDLTIGIHESKQVYTAVDRISMDICAGEIVGVVGESGCGKTVTNLALMGLLPKVLLVQGGSAEFECEDGHHIDLVKISGKERREINGNEISMIYQEPLTSLDPLMKIGRQVGEAVKIHNSGLSDEEVHDRVVKELGEVGLPDPHGMLEMYPHQLSGGMRQRVMIAMATVCRPRLMIADEPTTALDVTVQAQVLKLLKHINQKYGMTIVLISHDLSVISQICDRVVVMYAGRIAEAAPTQVIMTAPAHEYTKGLINSLPSMERKGSDLPCIPGHVPSTEEKREPCPFAPRCALADDICRQQEPPRRMIGEGHVVYCHFVK
jgi:oligopeptide/dipeptide ABC transporter ATP-binding protein